MFVNYFYYVHKLLQAAVDGRCRSLNELRWNSVSEGWVHHMMRWVSWSQQKLFSLVVKEQFFSDSAGKIENYFFLAPVSVWLLQSQSLWPSVRPSVTKTWLISYLSWQIYPSFTRGIISLISKFSCELELFLDRCPRDRMREGGLVTRPKAYWSQGKCFHWLQWVFDRVISAQFNYHVSFIPLPLSATHILYWWS